MAEYVELPLPPGTLDNKCQEAKSGKKVIDSYIRRNKKERAKLVNIEMVFEEQTLKSGCLSAKQMRNLMKRIKNGWLFSNIFSYRKIVIKVKILDGMDRYAKKNAYHNMVNGGKKMSVHLKVCKCAKYWR